MFTFKAWSEISKALRTAEQVKPSVAIEAPGIYRVSGRNGSEFKVVCSRDDKGKRIVDCGCVAGAKLHTPCFHAAAAVKAHVSRVTWNQAAF